MKSYKITGCNENGGVMTCATMAHTEKEAEQFFTEKFKGFEVLEVTCIEC